MMNIMYAADDNYAEIMGVSILSLLEHNKNEKIHFYIIEDEITKENIKKIENMIVFYQAEVTFLKKPDIRGKLGVELKTLRWSDSAYSRLFLKELFQKRDEVQRILYLDCDTLIVDSLEELWNINLDGYLGAAVLECMSNMHKWIIGAKAKDNYINTGVLVIDVNKWINNNVEEKAIEFIKRYKGNTEYVDQGVLNGFLSNYFRLMHPRFNLTALAYDFTYEEMQVYRKPHFGYQKNEWEYAIEHPVVIHFTTSFLSVRPWYSGSTHPYAMEWEKAHDKSPWKGNGWRKLEKQNKKIRKITLYHSLPRGVAINVAGVLHAWIKPLWYKFTTSL